MISSWSKFNEGLEADHRDNTDTGEGIASNRNTNYAQIQKFFKIDRSDIRNLLQDFLDEHEDILMECVYYNASVGFMIYFYKNSLNEWGHPDSDITPDKFKIEEDIKEEIDSRLSDWGLTSEIEFDSNSRSIVFNISRI